MKSVTYRGPEDPQDPTTRYRIGDHLLPVGVAVEVPNEVADELAATDGHSFEITTAGKAKGGSKTDEKADSAATKGD